MYMDSHTTSMSFAGLGIDDWLVQCCENMGIKNPTPIQNATIPSILEGKDVLGSAQTGSGKTAAFALPILQTLSRDPYGIYALVLTPTRELAFQIADQFKVLGKPTGTRTAVVVGGMNMMQQASELAKRPHIVIATPGRLVDHIKSTSSVSLGRIKYLVLDEADRLLDMGFTKQVNFILSVLPEKRQTLLFSATMTPNLQQLESIALTNPVRFDVSPELSTVEELSQEYIFVPDAVKDCYLVFILRQFEGRSVIVFSPTCKICQIVSDMLRELEVQSIALHSKMPQTRRLAALAKFKSQSVQVLVATDVASRGLDIPTVDLVINYDVPRRAEDYIHRVGRTARAGRGGHAITIVTQFDIDVFTALEEKVMKSEKMSKHDVNENKVVDGMNEISAARNTANLHLVESGFFDDLERKRKRKLLQDGAKTKFKMPSKNSNNKKKGKQG